MPGPMYEEELGGVGPPYGAPLCWALGPEPGGPAGGSKRCPYGGPERCGGAWVSSFVSNNFDLSLEKNPPPS